jgi:hypothetical protein
MVGVGDGKECVGLSVSVGKHAGKRQLGRPQREWEDVSLDHREISWMIMTKNRVQWRAVVLAMLNMNLLLPAVSEMDLGK